MVKAALGTLAVAPPSLGIATGPVSDVFGSRMPWKRAGSSTRYSKEKPGYRDWASAATVRSLNR